MLLLRKLNLLLTISVFSSSLSPLALAGEWIMHDGRPIGWMQASSTANRSNALALARRTRPGVFVITAPVEDFEMYLFDIPNIVRRARAANAQISEVVVMRCQSSILSNAASDCGVPVSAYEGSIKRGAIEQDWVTRTPSGQSSRSSVTEFLRRIMGTGRQRATDSITTVSAEPVIPEEVPVTPRLWREQGRGRASPPATLPQTTPFTDWKKFTFKNVAKAKVAGNAAPFVVFATIEVTEWKRPGTGNEISGFYNSEQERSGGLDAAAGMINHAYIASDTNAFVFGKLSDGLAGLMSTVYGPPGTSLQIKAEMRRTDKAYINSTVHRTSGLYSPLNPRARWWFGLPNPFAD